VSTPDNQRKNRGFTLAELLVTVVVMSILAVVAIPSASVNNERRLDMLQLQLQDAIDHAWSLAYHGGEKMSVHVYVPGQWFAVVDELGVPQEDPLTHKNYAIRLNAPGQEQNVAITYCKNPLDRSLVMFNNKGHLVYPVDIRISAGDEERWLNINTATGTLDEVPITSE
jgi:prepilin-type N-terminal cleavage/methylation domain-containing protein